MNLVELLTTTGFGSSLMIGVALIGGVWAFWSHAKKKPGAGTPGETNQKGTEIV